MTSTTTYSRSLSRARFLAAGTALLAAFALAPQAHAQGATPDQPRGDQRGQRMDPQQRVDRRVAMLTERLKLSSSQATQIRQVLTQENQQMQALWQEHGGFPGGRFGGQRGARGNDQPGDQGRPRRTDTDRPDSAARDSVRTVIRAIHDRTEQRTAYRELRESQRNGRRGGHRGERGDREGQTGAGR